MGKKIRVVINIALFASLVFAVSQIGLNSELIFGFLRSVGPLLLAILFCAGVLGMVTFSFVTARVFFRYSGREAPQVFLLMKTFVTQIGKYFPVGPLSVVAQGETFKNDKGGRKQSYTSVAYVYLSQISAGGLLTSLLLLSTPKLAGAISITSLMLIVASFVCLSFLHRISGLDAQFLQRAYILLQDISLLIFAWALVGLVTSVMIMSSGINDEMKSLIAVSIIAWLGGILAFIFPAGIGVRELIFTLLLDSADKTSLTTALVVARAYFILIDITLAVIGFYYLRNKSHPPS